MQVEAALSLWQNAYTDAAKLGEDHPFFSITLRNLGLLYFAKQDLDKAESLLRKSVKILQTFGANYPDLSIDYYFLGRIDSLKGNSQLAVNWYEKGIKICQEHPPDDDTMPQLLAFAATAYHALGAEEKEAEALKQFDNSIIKPDVSRAEAMGRTARLLTDDGGRCKFSGKNPYDVVADKIYTKAVNAFERHAISREFGLYLLNRAETRFRIGKSEQALSDVERADQMLSRFGYHQDLERTVSLKASCLMKLHRRQESDAKQ